MKPIAWWGALGLALGVTASGCSDECSSAFDCEADEVCSNGICAPSLASYVRCNSDLECNDGDPNGPFECIAGGCRLIGTTGGMVPTDGGQEAGVPADSGTVDAGTPDTGTPDTGTPDTGAPDSGAMDAASMDAASMDAAAMDGGGAGGSVTAAVGGAATDFSSMTSATFDEQGTMEATVLGQDPNGDIMLVRFPASFPGTFNCGAGATVQYVRAGQTFRADMTNGMCTINVTAFGTVGMPVVGNFTATVIATDTTQLVLTNGMFNVTRTQ